jgi:predicted PhzF superfamily epimerase YddE/YHI9
VRGSEIRRRSFVRETPIVQVDAFTSEPFRGNPAAVCVLDAPRDASWMQNVALEMNVSETAFLVPAARGFDLRWFTPVKEVALCGHATLAGAHVLWETGRVGADETAVFQTKSGELTARRTREGIELNFPAYRVSNVEPPPLVRRVFGVEPANVASVPKTNTETNYIVEFASEAVVRELRPDLGPIREPGSPGLIATARGESVDYVCRYFVPAAGIDEDPVTGSVNCALAVYWAERLGKRSMTVYQASARGGRMRVELDGERVRLTGHAVTTLRGTLYG